MNDQGGTGVRPGAVGLGNEAATIDYDRIYAEYLQSLVDTLRGFSTGIDGLDLFVPHEDPLLGFRNLLDAAVAAGRRELAVRFGPVSLARVDGQALRELGAQYGRTQLLATDSDVLIAIDGIVGRQVQTSEAAPKAARVVRRSDAPSDVVPRAPTDEIYARALAATHIHHEGFAEAGARDDGAEAAGAADRTVIAVCAPMGALRLQIDRATHTIEEARFRADDSRRALMERFCDLIESLPLLEAAQHGLLRLEASLRDPAQPRPVPGIVLPRSAHPMFDLPATLIADALARYRSLTGYDQRDNRYDSGTGRWWRTATPTERLAALETALTNDLALEARFGVTAGDLEITAIEYDVRVVVALPAADFDRQALLMHIERVIKDKVDPRLEIYAEERKDRNKLRRLAVVGGKPIKASAKEADS